MTKARELLQKAIRNPASLRFEEMVRLAEAFGFRQATGTKSGDTYPISAP